MEHQEVPKMSSRAERAKLAETISQLDSTEREARKKNFDSLVKKAKNFITTLRGGEDALRLRKTKKELLETQKNEKRARNERAGEIRQERRERDVKTRESEMAAAAVAAQEAAEKAAQEEAERRALKQAENKQKREARVQKLVTSMEKRGRLFEDLVEGTNALRVRFAERSARINSEKANQLREKMTLRARAKEVLQSEIEDETKVSPTEEASEENRRAA